MKKMRIISIVWGFLLLLILTTLTIFSMLWKEKQEKYQIIEERLKEAAEKKLIASKETPVGIEVLTYTYEDLKKEGYVDELNVENDKCIGYVDIKQKDTIIYQAYIKCNKYKTEGYIE